MRPTSLARIARAALCLAALAFPAAAAAETASGTTSEEAALAGETLGRLALRPAGEAGPGDPRFVFTAPAGPAGGAPASAPGSAIAPITWPRPSLIVPDDEGTFASILAEAAPALFGRPCAGPPETHAWMEVAPEAAEAFGTSLGEAVEAAGFGLDVRPVEGGLFLGASREGQDLAIAMFPSPEQRAMALTLCDASPAGVALAAADGAPGAGGGAASGAGDGGEGAPQASTTTPEAGADPAVDPTAPLPEPAGFAARSAPILGLCLVLFGLYRLFDRARGGGRLGGAAGPAAGSAAGLARVPARIVSSAVRRESAGGATRFVPRVRFSFEHGGRAHVGDRLGPVPLAFADEAVAEAVAEAYPVGRAVVARFDPRAPGAASLDDGSGAPFETGRAGGAGAWLAAALPSLLFVAAGAAVLYVTWGA